MDWPKLGESLATRLQLPATKPRVASVHGGDINRAYRLELGAQVFFVKINVAALLPMFVAERAGLDAIRQCGAIRVPEVYACGCEDAESYIVMEYIALAGPPDAERLADDLASLHGNFHPRFGFDGDNTIGSTPQINRFNDDWVEFWRLNRLGFQLQLAADNGLDARLIDAGQRLAQNLQVFFEGYQPRASLLHGDLWSGNQGADSEGRPVIYDPACYYGDHEADLAMMELFGSPGTRFFARYRDSFVIDAGYETRRMLYNLYHVLNHANLFAGGYAGQALGMVERLLALQH